MAVRIIIKLHKACYLPNEVVNATLQVSIMPSDHALAHQSDVQCIPVPIS